MRGGLLFLLPASLSVLLFQDYPTRLESINHRNSRAAKTIHIGQGRRRFL
jgi:hypothetical protein